MRIKLTQPQFNTALISLYFLIGLIGILNHSMWRDELNPWLMTRDSHSFIELFGNLRYEGHPGLWYLCLYGLNQFTANPLAMQLLHLGIATATIYIFIRFSPFPNWQKILFSFGYLPIYEYLVISRNYAIGFFFAFTFCALFQTRFKTYLWLAITLLLMANTNAYCFFISVALGTTLILEYILSRYQQKDTFIHSKYPKISLLIFLLGIILCLVQLIPPNDSMLAGGASDWTLTFDIHRFAMTLVTVWNGYIVSIVPAANEVMIFAFISLFFLIFSTLLFIYKPFPLFLYVFGNSIILTFNYLKFIGGPRHHGNLFILLIVCLWLAKYYPKQSWISLENINLQNKVSTIINLVQKNKVKFISLLLISQLAAGIVALSRDLIVPLSASRETANFIRYQKLDQMFMMGSVDYAISPLCGYLNRQIYYPEIGQFGSFVLFRKSRKNVDATEVLTQANSLLHKQNDSPNQILLVLNQELTVQNSALKISPVAQFTRSFMSDEKYYLYLLSRSKV